MALISCPECSQEISDKAEACPHCGFPVTKLSIKSVNCQIEDTIENSSSISSNPKLETELLNYTSESRNKEAALAVKSFFIIIGIFIVIYVAANAYQNKDKKSESVKQLNEATKLINMESKTYYDWTKAKEYLVVINDSFLN